MHLTETGELMLGGIVISRKVLSGRAGGIFPEKRICIFDYTQYAAFIWI